MARAADTGAYRWLRWQYRYAPVYFLAPAVILFSVFVLWPIAQSLWLSLFEWGGFGPKQWVGLDNYRNLAADPRFTVSLRNNVTWLVLMLLAPLGGLAVAAPYRLLRIQSFLDPWAEPFGSGYQLTQSLIAIGSGGLFGQGLGGGVQKHFYLPEMHTDFVFAVAAEELGLLGAALIVVLFGLFALGALRAARQAQAAEQDFAAAVACGVGLWIGLQAFVNIAVNMGALPTKGLTLPFMSAGGSSLVASFAGLGLLWRVHRELDRGAAGRRERRPA